MIKPVLIHFSLNHTHHIGKIILLILLSISRANAEDIKIITPRLIDRGRVQEDTNITDHILFINNSGKVISIDRIRSSCGCTTTRYSQGYILPGDTVNIAYTIRTAGFRGVIRKTITVYFKEQNINPLTYTVQANIYQLFDIQPRYLYFSDLYYNPDTTVTEMLSIQNSQDKSMVINIHSDSKLIKVTPASFSLKPNTSKEVVIAYTPAQKGYHLSYITVKSDYLAKPEVKISIFTNVYNY